MRQLLLPGITWGDCAGETHVAGARSETGGLHCDVSVTELSSALNLTVVQLHGCPWEQLPPAGCHRWDGPRSLALSVSRDSGAHGSLAIPVVLSLSRYQAVAMPLVGPLSVCRESS